MCNQKSNITTLNLIICNLFLIFIGISCIISDSSYDISKGLTLKKFCIILLIMCCLSLIVSCIFIINYRKNYEKIVDEV